MCDSKFEYFCNGNSVRLYRIISFINFRIYKILQGCFTEQKEQQKLTKNLKLLINKVSDNLFFFLVCTSVYMLPYRRSGRVALEIRLAFQDVDRYAYLYKERAKL